MQLVAEKLAGERGGEIVFSDVSFQVGDGQALTVTGPNGSGKSTLLRIVAGLLEPAAGVIRLDGSRLEWPTIASAAHYLGHGNSMKPALTVSENLRFWRGFLGEAHLDVDEALDMVGARRSRSSALRLSLDRPAPARRDRASCRQLSAAMAPRRADLGARPRVRDAVHRIDAGHREEGGIIVAATHQPLGLDDAVQLRLTGQVQPVRETLLSSSMRPGVDRDAGAGQPR